MLLILLLGTIAVGLVSFLALWPVERSDKKHFKKFEPVIHPLTDPRQIKKELDHILVLYQRGSLDEVQYNRLSDELIDQLADVMHLESEPVH